MTSVTSPIESPDIAAQETTDSACETQCPLSHRVVRRFFSGVIAILLIMIVVASIYVLMSQR